MSFATTNFLTQATQVAQKNIHVEGYSITDFAYDLAVSKSSLNKKMKVLTGLTPIEFLEKIKFRFAKRLFKETDFSVKEIAYSSGFNDPKYFTRRFKKEFGVTPKEYRNSIKNTVEIFWGKFVMN